MIGLFGSGAAGALGARPAGGFADKGKSHLTTTFGLLLLLLSAGYLAWAHLGTGADYWYSGTGPHRSGVHITNQTVIYRLHPDARNRLTAGYMTSYFIGGAAGSLISASATCRLGRRLSGGCHGSLT